VNGMAKKKEDKKEPTKDQKPVAKTEPIVVVTATHVLGQAPEHHAFVLKDGKKLRSLFELADVLEQTTDDVFGHHVNPGRNDFSTWVRDIFNDKFLADDMKKALHRLEMQRVLLKKLVKELLRKSKV